MPISVATDGANTHDMRRVKATLESLPAERPEPTDEAPQHLCADKGYEYATVRETLAAWGCTIHIASRGEDRRAKAELPGDRARRWVVERTQSWFNRIRRLLIR